MIEYHTPRRITIFLQLKLVALYYDGNNISFNESINERLSKKILPEDFHYSECAAQVLFYCVASLVIKNK